MVGEGRESQKDNDLFFTCGLIEYIARKTKNIRSEVVNKLGKERISKIYKDKLKWNKMSLINIANSGIFSSDRTINEYIEDIWFRGCDENVQNNII